MSTAQALAISSETVKTHLKRIFTKLDAYSRKHAVNRARNLGMLTLACCISRLGPHERIRAVLPSIPSGFGARASP